MFSKNIKYLRLKNGLLQSELASKVGLTGAAVSRWETDENRVIPPLKTLTDLSIIFNIPVEALLTEDLERKDKEEKANETRDAKRYIKIKVYGSIPAGLPNQMIAEPIGEEDIPEEWERGGREYFGLKVKGNSMYPKYMDGDIVIVRKQELCDSGDDCIVRINGDEATFKKVIWQNATTILQPINPEYPPQVFTGGDDEPDIHILGVVVELRRTVK